MDCHKWLNVPYDCGFVAVVDRAAHYDSTRMTGAYLVPAPDRELDPFDWVPEASRRGRATTVYAALRSLGRDGVAELVDRCCALAGRIADRLGAEPGIAILNDVVLNQVLVRFDDSDERTRAVIAAVQEDGTCWAGGTTWHGMAAMRISVSSWATTEADIDRSADAIIRCFRASQAVTGCRRLLLRDGLRALPHVVLGVLATTAVRVEAAHEDVGELPVDGGPIVGQVERPAVGDERVAVDREHLVVGLPRAGLVGIGEPRGDDRRPVRRRPPRTDRRRSARRR